MQPFKLAWRIKLTSADMGAVPNVWQSWVTACRSITGPLAQHLLCISRKGSAFTLQWRHNGGDGVSNHQHHHCLLNRWFRRRSKKTSKFRVTATGEFPAQMASKKCFHLMMSSWPFWSYSMASWRHWRMQFRRREHIWGPHGVSDEHLIRLHSN